MSKRIDSLKPNSRITLQFNGRGGNRTRREPALFLGVTGTGDDRRAKFRSFDDYNFRTYEWEAYRFEGFWAYGSSADRLQLISVDGEV